MPHIHELIDFVSDVYIVCEDKVLLRQHDKYKVWLPPGGHIELNENPNEAAIREVKEEVGLDIELYKKEEHLVKNDEGCILLIPPMHMNIHEIDEIHKHISMIYFARSKIDKLILSKTEESAGCHWFTKQELYDPKYKLKNSVKFYASDALKHLI